MTKIINECRDCANETYPCIGDSCGFRNVKHLICDGCGSDEETLYILDDGNEYCLECVKDKLPKKERT